MAKTIRVVRSGTNFKHLKEKFYGGLNQTSVFLPGFVKGSNVRIRRS